MKKPVLFIMLLLVAASCKQKEKDQFPCGDLYNPSFLSFVYVDSNGKPLINTATTIETSQPCSNYKPEVSIHTEDGRAYFVLGPGLTNEKSYLETCPEVHITLNGTDTDTLVFTGESELIRAGSKECTPLYRYEPSKVMFNGVELPKKHRERSTEPEEYYELKK